MDSSNDYNNMGVAYLENGYRDSALLMFQAAIDSKLRTIKRHEQQPLQQESHASSIQDHLNKQSRTSINSFALNMYTTINTKRIPFPSDSASIMHNKPIKIDIELREHSDCNGETDALHSAIFMYNAALAHHLNNTAISLDRALKLYEMICPLLADNQDISSDTCCRLVIVTLNNLAQLHMDLGLHAEVMPYVDALSEFARNIRDSRSCSFLEEMDTITSNALIFSDPNLAPASAA